MKIVEILLATYKPNPLFFRKLLNSLNNQTYPNIHLTIRDDSGDQSEFKKVESQIANYIKAFPFTIKKNDVNIGSNRTFEKMTEEASSDYIAFCDQDDIWEINKVEKLVYIIEREKAVLAYSDLSIIDKNDKLIANSFKKINKRLTHLAGNGLFEHLLRRNSVTGCAMLIKTQVAKKAIPFCTNYYVHDHWLALYASMIGSIAYTSEPLIQYRIHDNNQIGDTMLRGIATKDDYYNNKLLFEKEKYSFLLNEYQFESDYNNNIIKIERWTEERINFFEERNIRNTLLMLLKIKDDYQLIMFELGINILPAHISNKIINKFKK